MGQIKRVLVIVKILVMLAPVIQVWKYIIFESKQYNTNFLLRKIMKILMVLVILVLKQDNQRYIN